MSTLAERWAVPAELAAWLGLAVAVGASGVLAELPLPWPQAVAAGLTLLTLLSLWFFDPVRRWADRTDPRVFVGFHATRFVGIYFLVLHARGELPYEFAVLGGWGDIVVAAFAVALVATGPPRGRRRPAYLVWNVVGLADILFAVATATRLGLADRGQMAPMFRLPLSLLITFVVSLVIATHVWLFRRLWHAGAGDAGPPSSVERAER